MFWGSWWILCFIRKLSVLLSWTLRRWVCLSHSRASALMSDNFYAKFVSDCNVYHIYCNVYLPAWTGIEFITVNLEMCKDIIIRLYIWRIEKKYTDIFNYLLFVNLAQNKLIAPLSSWKMLYILPLFKTFYNECLIILNFQCSSICLIQVISCYLNFFCVCYQIDPYVCICYLLISRLVLWYFFSIKWSRDLHMLWPC